MQYIIVRGNDNIAKLVYVGLEVDANGYCGFKLAELNTTQLVILVHYCYFASCVTEAMYIQLVGALHNKALELQELAFV